MRALLLLALVGLSARCDAQSREDPVRFLLWPVQDIRAIPGAVTPTRLLVLGGAGATLYGLSRYDRDLTREAAVLSENAGLRVAQEFGNARAVRPALAVVFLGGLMAGDDRMADAAFTALESVILANLITNGLKGAFGRARPWQGEGPDSFAPFSGNTSFPSGHSTTAWAALTPFAQYYGGATEVVLYGLAATTAFSRMATEAHWLSDVLAGSAIGFTTAYALTRRHRSGVRISVAPGSATFQLQF